MSIAADKRRFTRGKSETSAPLGKGKESSQGGANRPKKRGRGVRKKEGSAPQWKSQWKKGAVRVSSSESQRRVVVDVRSRI